MESQRRKKVLVIGDAIHDYYIFGRTPRICPEAPVPVFIADGSVEKRPGGACLVTAQLEALGGIDVVAEYGSTSNKTRYFSQGHLLLRVDDDNYTRFMDSERNNLAAFAVEQLKTQTYDAVVISDYDKGTFTDGLADTLMWQCAKFDIPTFVDSKKNWDWYVGAHFFFPNENETPKPNPRNKFTTVVQKLGSRGASVNGEIIPPLRSHAVKDTTGAGDTFLAAFVYSYLKSAPITNPRQHAEFANRVAGLSVEHIGTHVVTKEELDKSYE